MKKNYFMSVLLTLVLLMPAILQAQISTFDDLTLDSTNAYWNGSDLSGGFQSGSALFLMIITKAGEVGPDLHTQI